MSLIALRSPETWGKIRFAAEMEARQLHALKAKIAAGQLVKEIATIDRLKNPRLGKTADLRRIKGWLKNGWNTERLFRLTGSEFKEDALAAAVQWAFPMAYYSTFAVTSAFFEAASYTETTHSSIIKKVGSLMVGGNYPPTLSFAATGTKKSLEYHGIEKPDDEDESSISFDPSDEASVDKHVCQFLKATRERHLDEKKQEVRFYRQDGKRKVNLNEAEWEQVSETLGPTSILSLLYRKRIKAHYRDIDSFAEVDVDALEVFRSLSHVVACLNFTHETMIAAGVGRKKYAAIVEDFVKGREAAECPKKRLNTINNVLDTA